MKRTYVPLALVAAVLAAACGKPKVVVRAQLDGGPVSDLPVRLLSYDGKAIRDSLARAAKTPEPAFPQDLIQQLRQIDGELASARQRGDTAVARVDAVRRALLARADTIRAAQQAWAARAYARFDTVVMKKTSQRGLVIREDTTDAAGRAEFKGDDKGRWWISAHYTLQYSQLDWNVAVDMVAGKDTIVVVLNRANAVETPAL
jgi:hypothetical protein